MAILGWLRSRRGDAQGKQSSNAHEPAAEPMRRRSLDGLGTASQTINESISVALRRQVPIRSDEKSSSYLGGLPCLPAGTEWPRTSSGMPLNFIAQVDCANLPPELWGGFGPRTGWLLLFADMEALTDQEDRPFARVLHVDELGPEAQPPAGLYFARSSVLDQSRCADAVPDRQRLYFRRWPVDLVTVGADTSELTGSALYGAPEDDLILSAHEGIPFDRPMTWGGVYDVLVGLIMAHELGENGDDVLRRLGAMSDYPEPDANGYNKEWQERRENLPERIEFSYHSPQFTAADERLKVQMYEERRQGWTQRAFKVLDEETAITQGHLEDYKARLAKAQAAGDDGQVNEIQHSVDYFERQLADRHAHRAYLTDLFAQYPGEDALVDEIRRSSSELEDWARKTQQRLRQLLDLVKTIDPRTPLDPQDWDDLLAEIAGMKSTYWTRTHDTDVLRKVERPIHVSCGNVVREEVLDRYASSTPLAPELLANLEPRMRHLECERPHKLGGRIDSVYDEPLKRAHLLLFQMASDAAVGWIFGDLGFLYVSIHQNDLAAGRFDQAIGWLEA